MSKVIHCSNLLQITHHNQTSFVTDHSDYYFGERVQSIFDIMDSMAEENVPSQMIQ